ncbi:MAG: GNAT family N-acetyltransferase, partial [Chloroflexota bacterium]
MASVHPRYFPTPYQDSPQSGRLILRDGSTATIRLSRTDDQEALKEFFAGLSDQSRHRRFFANTPASERWIRSCCDSSNPRASLTLVVTRLSDESRSRIIATGSYFARDETTAEIALAVDDRFQGKGVGTLILERLALLAVANGFRHLQAVTMAENQLMIEVFRASGFELRTRQEAGYVEIDLSVRPSPTSIAQAEWRDRVATNASLRPFFRPRSVAVVGASRNPA